MNSFQGKAAKSALIGGLYCNKAMLWDSVVSLLATMIGLLGDKRKQAPTRFGPGGGTEGGTKMAQMWQILGGIRSRQPRVFVPQFCPFLDLLQPWDDFSPEQYHDIGRFVSRKQTKTPGSQEPGDSASG